MTKSEEAVVLGLGSASQDPEQVTLKRLEDQLEWYERRSRSAKNAYRRVQTAQLLLSAVVPVVAALEVRAAITAAVASLVVVAEGLQQLFQWQPEWLAYRSTAEALKHEKYLYLAHAGPYRKDDRGRALAERLEGLVSQEHAKWTGVHQDAVESSAHGLPA